MGTYFWFSAAALVLLGAILWWGWEPPGPGPDTPQVRWSTGAGWKHAALEQGTALHTLLPGQQVSLAAGRYRLTLVPAVGAPRWGSLELVPGDDIDLDDLLQDGFAPDDSLPPGDSTHDGGG